MLRSGDQCILCLKLLKYWLIACAGKSLQAQYERWQARAKYRMHLDPTVEDVKKLAQSCRRNAKVKQAATAAAAAERGRAWDGRSSIGPDSIRKACL